MGVVNRHILNRYHVTAHIVRELRGSVAYSDGHLRAETMED